MASDPIFTICNVHCSVFFDETHSLGRNGAENSRLSSLLPPSHIFPCFWCLNNFVSIYGPEVVISTRWLQKILFSFGIHKMRWWFYKNSNRNVSTSWCLLVSCLPLILRLRLMLRDEGSKKFRYIWKKLNTDSMATGKFKKYCVFAKVEHSQPGDFFFQNLHIDGA